MVLNEWYNVKEVVLIESEKMHFVSCWRNKRNA